MNQLREHMEFGQALPGTHRQVPVWLIHGRWRKESLEAMLPTNEVDSTAQVQGMLKRLPQQIPHFVTVTIGKEDLFPYRLEFGRFSTDAGSGKTGKSGDKVRTIVLDLFEVAFDVSIGPAKFDRSNTDIPFVDGTADYLRQNGLEISP